MRSTLKRIRFAAWAVAIVVLYAVGNPCEVWRIYAARHVPRHSDPDTGSEGAGVPSPLHPPPPILHASIAKQLPGADDAET